MSKCGIDLNYEQEHTLKHTVMKWVNLVWNDSIGRDLVYKLDWGN